jgi:hypothetical protein
MIFGCLNPQHSWPSTVFFQGPTGADEGSFLALGFDGRFLYSVATEGAAAWEPSEDVVHLYGSVSKPCTPVVHIKIAGVYWCSSH